MANNTELLIADVMAAIQKLDNKIDHFGQQLKDNSEMFANIIQRVE